MYSHLDLPGLVQIIFNWPMPLTSQPQVPPGNFTLTPTGIWRTLVTTEWRTLCARVLLRNIWKNFWSFVTNIPAGILFGKGQACFHINFDVLVKSGPLPGGAKEISGFYQVCLFLFTQRHFCNCSREPGTHFAEYVIKLLVWTIWLIFRTSPIPTKLKFCTQSMFLYCKEK